MRKTRSLVAGLKMEIGGAFGQYVSKVWRLPRVFRLQKLHFALLKLFS